MKSNVKKDTDQTNKVIEEYFSKTISTPFMAKSQIIANPEDIKS